MLNFDRFAIGPAFTVFGEAATYSAPAGSPTPCRLIREGGGQPVTFGPVKVFVDTLRFEVRTTEVPAPVSGGTFTVGADTFTVTGKPYHPEDDAHGLVWCCPVLWGAPLVFRSMTGSGSTQNPPNGSGFTIAANAVAGAGAVNVRSGYVVGQVRPGDKLVIGGTVHTITNSVTAATNVFTGIAVTPALAAPVTTGEAVEFRFARDYAVLGAVAGYEANSLLGGVQAGDRRVIVMQSSLTAAGCTDAPKGNDKITFEGRQFNVQTAAAVYEGASPAAWDLQCR